MDTVYEQTCGSCDKCNCAFCKYNKSKDIYELYHGKVEPDGCQEYME